MFDTLPCEHAVSRNRTDRSSLLGLRSSCPVVQFAGLDDNGLCLRQGILHPFFHAPPGVERRRRCEQAMESFAEIGGRPDLVLSCFRSAPNLKCAPHSVRLHLAHHDTDRSKMFKPPKTPSMALCSLAAPASPSADQAQSQHPVRHNFCRCHPYPASRVLSNQHPQLPLPRPPS